MSGVFVDGDLLVDEAMSATIDVCMFLIEQPKAGPSTHDFICL